MPKVKLSDEERRAAVLAALSGVPMAQVGRRHGISREHVRRLAKEARASADDELCFWLRVREIMGK